MAYNKVFRPILGVIKRNTDKAVLLVVENPDAITDDDAEIENWIPKSQIAQQIQTKNSKGQTVVMMSEWIIGQKGLASFVMTDAMLAAIKAQANASAPIAPAVPTTPAVKPFSEINEDDIPF